MIKYKEIHMDHQEFKQFIKICPFLSSLKGKFLDKIYSVCHERTLQPGEYLMREGDPGNEIYLVFDGELEILKRDSITENQYVISRVKKGATIGELALLDSAPRSASVRAFTVARVLQISFADIRPVPEKDNDITLFLELAKKTTEKLRYTNDIALDALKSEIEQRKLHEHMGRFLIYVLIMISCFIYLLPLFKYLMKISSNSTYVTVPLILFFIAFTVIFMINTKLPLATFGITLNHWKRALFEAVLWTIPVGGGVVILKLLAIRYYPPYFGHKLFEPYILQVDNQKSFKYWLLFTAVYWIFIPLQELVARGTVQSLLQEFLIGKYRIVASIIISNLLFGIVHFVVSEQLGIVIFLIGLYLGALYANTRNLIAPIVAHMLIGTWALSVVGVVFNF